MDAAIRRPAGGTAELAGTSTTTSVSVIAAGPLPARDTDSKPPNIRQPKVVFPLHGIRTRADWQRIFSDAANNQGWLCRLEHWYFGFFWVIRLLIPWQRRAKVRWFRKTYDQEVHDRDVKVNLQANELPSVVAHSFGTYILGNALLKYDYIRFNKVILCGSILPLDFPWDELIERGQVQAVRNEYGIRDWPTRVVRYAVGDSGPSGVYGFTCRHERFAQEQFDYTHSEYFDRGHIEDRWLPFLEKSLDVIPRTQRPVRRPRGRIPFLYWALLWAVLICIGYFVSPWVLPYIQGAWDWGLQQVGIRHATYNQGWLKISALPSRAEPRFLAAIWDEISGDQDPLPGNSRAGLDRIREDAGFSPPSFDRLSFVSPAWSGRIPKRITLGPDVNARIGGFVLEETNGSATVVSRLDNIGATFLVGIGLTNRTKVRIVLMVFPVDQESAEIISRGDLDRFLFFE